MNQTLVNQLKLGIVTLNFRKRDGSLRKMRATLVPELIGIETYSRNTGPEHIQCVWDIDKDEWRSFRWDCLIDFESEQSQRAA